MVGFAVPGAAACECAAQQFAGHGHAKAFVVAKGHECAKQAVGLRHHHHAGVGGGVAVFVDQVTRWHLFPLVVRHPHLALGHAAGGKVQHKGGTVAHGHANAAGVGAKAPVATTKRRDHGAREHVHKMHRHQALRHGHFGEVADATQVVRAAQGHGAHAVLLGALDPHLHGLHAGDLAVAALAVQVEQWTGVEQHLHARVGAQAAFEHRIHIAWHHAHAVRVVPAQVGHDQVVGHLRGFSRGAARLFNDMGDFGAQRCGLDALTHDGPYRSLFDSCHPGLDPGSIFGRGHVVGPHGSRIKSGMTNGSQGSQGDGSHHRAHLPRHKLVLAVAVALALGGLA